MYKIISGFGFQVGSPKEDSTAEIIEPIILTDVEKLPSRFLPNIGVLCVDRWLWTPHIDSVIFHQKEKAAVWFVVALKILLKSHLMTNQLRLGFYTYHSKTIVLSLTASWT